MAEKRSLFSFLRRKTPTPADRKVFNLGIQERDQSYFMTAPIIYHIASQSVILRTCTTQIKNEIFRRGFRFKKAFEDKCESCGNEHENKVEECSSCGSKDLYKPDKHQVEYAEKLLEHKYVNNAEQLFVDVLKELEDDLNIMDDAYIILVKEYFVDGNQDIQMHRIVEMYRGDPATMAIYTDEVGERGNKGFTCLTHRMIIENEYNACEECGGELHPIYYVNRVNGEEQYYIKGEILHFSKYSPSRLYGQSPVLTLFNHIVTLIAMENYVNAAYTKSRMPRGLLAVQTRNMESMQSFWRAVKEKMETDPHFIPVMGIESEGGKGSVEWIKFMDSLKEMDYIAVKEDLRDRVAAFYGVSKIFMADSSTSGGLNNEGMQILVTNRAVEMAQRVYNDYVFPFIMKEFGITDWELVLPPSEEEDEIAILRKREIEVNIAASTKNLGFEVEMDEDGQFTYKKPPPQQPEPEGEEEQAETDPYAGTDIDAAHMGEMQEQALSQKPSPEGEGGATRNKASMSVGPPNRAKGLPAEAANNNVDRRTERKVG